MIDKFLEYIVLEKRYSLHTMKSYQRDLLDFQEFVAYTGGRDVLNVDSKVVRNFMTRLSQNGLSKRTINRKLSSLRSFYLFLLKVGAIDSSPVESIRSLKFYPEKQVVFSREEMQEFSKIENLGMSQFFLKTLLVEVLYQTGLRRSEICNLRLDQVDMDSCLLEVVGKGNKMRMVPISEDLVEQLRNYLENYRKGKAGEPIFFLNNKGRKLNGQFVYRAVKECMSHTSSKKKKSPHILRHSFATHVLGNGAEISKVGSILGHASLASTQVYTHADIEQLRSVVDKAHPRSKNQH